jgi:signal transduction histidine kinase
VTPDAVIYRYLQIAQPDIDIELLCALLSADADLLARWLKVLRVPADATALRLRLSELDSTDLDNLAQAQAWSVLPLVGSAHLGMDQWYAVLRASCLAQVLAEHLLPRGTEPDAGEPEQALNIRLRALLGLSGVHLPLDRRLSQLVDFRGASPALLEDAALELRIFAVVDAVEVGRELESAQQLLGLEQDTFAQLAEAAEAKASALLLDLDIDRHSDVDWAERIWLHQQIAVVTAGFVHCRSLESLVELHQLASRSLFAKPPLMLVQTEPNGPMALLADAAISIRQDNQASAVASCLRNASGAAISDAADLAVVDRQLMRELDCDSAYVVPLSTSEPAAAMVVATDDDTEADTAAEMYATQLGSYLRGLDAESAADSDPQSSMLEEFKAREHRRLREIVHEANNPLSIVHNYLHILELRLQHEPEAVEQLEMIAAELRRAGQVIAQARDVPDEVELETAAPGEMIRVDLGEWATRMAELHSGFASEHGVPLHASIPDHDVVIETDQDKLTQVVTNLVKNAIEACGPGDEVLLGVRAGVYRDGRVGAEVFVEDTGPGLNDEVLENLEGAKRSSKGGDHQGLGIQVAFKLAEELEGALDVRTESGQGTTFSLFLPIR